jgi:magnesium transporter
MAAALITGAYEHLLEAVIALALFVPVTLTVSESIAMQSVTLTLQHLHAGPASLGFLLRTLRRELATAAFLGAACGALVAAIAWTWKGNVAVAAAAGITVTLAMVVAALLASRCPACAHAETQPRIASGPIVLALTDVVTLLCYFNVARMVL